MILLIDALADSAKMEIELFAESLKNANELLTSGQSFVERRQWEAAHREFSDAIDLQPNYYLVWVQRAQLYGRLKCWRQAADDFARAIELGAPVDEPSLWGAASLFACDQRTSDYDTVVKKLLEDDEQSMDVSWNAIRSAMVMERAGVDYQRLASVAEKKLERRRGERPDRERNDPV